MSSRSAVTFSTDTTAAFFSGHSRARKLFDALARLVGALGPFRVRVTRSQIAFRRRRNFAVVWMPGQVLAGEVAPLVLTLSFPRRDPSPRWKEVVRVSPGRYTHHLELHDVADVDAEVRAWITSARDAAGP